MSDGVQITIPDFDDEDDFTSTPVFGRSTVGGLWGAAGRESPTTSTPVVERGERSFFHSRGDSVASEDSAHSIQQTSRKFKAPFVHSANSSVATTSSSPFSKKSSFASLRNAFKSSKSNDPAPPVPSIDHSAYPAALKNPFNRSTSSLAHHAPSRPSIHAQSPPQMRPATPASGDSKSRTGHSKSKGHASNKSQHSHSGSIFHSSDPGSDHGHGMPYVSPLSPPPVPRVPSAFGGYASRDDIDIDDKLVVDARTPSDFALHAVFIRFARCAEDLIHDFVLQPLDRDPRLEDFMGPGVDVKFDEVLTSLGKIAQKHAKPVVDSIMRWRKSQNDVTGHELQRVHSGPAKVARMQDAFLTERGSLASIYIMCRALIAVTQSPSRDAFTDAIGNRLEELTFDQFRRPDAKLLLSSTNHRTNAELYAVLLGNLANVRFESVTDRFLDELSPVAAGQVPKDADFKYEYLVKGLRHVQLRVWPPESFEEGAEFLASLSKSFENAHGNRLKTSFAETLVHLMYAVAKTAQAEVNHPQWAKAIEVIYPRSRDMAGKPRYWQIAYPLSVVSLCVAPRDYFLRNWTSCVEAGLGKLKEKPCRLPVLNGILRLLWTYLCRCHEPGSTVATKLEMLLKNFFPPNRLHVAPSEDRIELFAYLVHMILSRQFDFGSELCLELLQERHVKSAQSGNISAHLAPERMFIAVQAILMSLRLIETEDSVPTWPSSQDFAQVPSPDDYPTSSDFLPPTLKPDWAELVERSGSVLSTLAMHCYQSVGKMSVFDEQWSASRLSPSYEEAHNYIIRQHPEGNIAYPIQLQSQINVLQLCYQSWPRLLHPSLPHETVFEMLLRGVVHVEPGISQAASEALERCTAEFSKASTLLSRFYSVVFDPRTIANEGSGLRLAIESTAILGLWTTILTKWSVHITERSRESYSETELQTISVGLQNVEAAALFMMSFTKRTIYNAGVKSIRILGTIHAHLNVESNSPNSQTTSTAVSVVDVLLGKTPRDYMHDQNDVLDTEELTRLGEWRNSDKADAALRMAESENVIDRALWKHIFPAIVQSFADQQTQSLLRFREKLVAAVQRYHSFVVQLSGISVKSPAGHPSRSLSIGEKEGTKMIAEHRQSIQQWHMWIKLICTTAQVEARPAPSPSTRDHARARSELNLERESLTTSRDLFRYLSPFLDSDSTVFRDAAVSCISSFPPSGYSHLLEDLSMLVSRQVYDDHRSKGVSSHTVGRVRRQERFQSAVASIYYLTANMLTQQRSSGKQSALAHILKYIRTTQAFLSSPDNRDLFSLQRLRRYFCGALERFFDGLATLNNSDRFIPPGMHLSLYRMCEEWCQLGKQSDSVKKRLVHMQTAAARSLHDPVGQAELIQRFQTETRALSNAAIGAMASLIQKAFFPPEVEATGSPTDKLEQSKDLDAAQTLDRIVAILASFTESVQDYGKKALRSLLTHNPYPTVFSDEVLRRAFVTARDLSTSNARFFEVVADVVCNAEHSFTFSQVVCLGLSNLCHPVLEIRRQAFNMLETIHEQSAGLLSISQHEAAVSSLAPSTYLHAHRLISDILAGEHPQQAVSVLAQFAGWIPRVYDGRKDSGPIILLQSLESWVPSVKLMTTDRTELSRNGRMAVYHLIALTLRYAETYAEQILVLWKGLVDIPSNGHAVVRFLLEQSQKVGGADFISCSAKVVACLSQSAIGRQLFEELCGVIEPPRMLPTYDHKLVPPDEEDLELWSDLNILFPQQRLNLGMAQYALLFLSECAMERYWELQEQLPVLLHALLLHVDHRQPFVQQQCRHMLFQLLRSCLPGYDEILDRPSYPTRSSLKLALSRLQEEASDKLWKEDDSSSQAEPKMRWFCAQVLGFLEPIFRTLAENWAPLSLYWATSCAIRPFAFRSLQIYRALSATIDQSGFDALLARLSNTIAEDEKHAQSFTVEVLITLTSIVNSSDVDTTLFAQMFWCAVACLSTTVEEEFLCITRLLDALMGHLDLDDSNTVDVLLSERPPAWRGSACLQIPLLTGLRSSKTAGETFALLQRLARVGDGRLIDPSERRVRDLYTISLPWCLHAMSNNIQDDALEEFAMNIGRLADEEERPSITRIMTSFAKKRFRTKDDFLRQSVASLREHYGTDYWADIVTLLVGLVLNTEVWLRVHTLQILKVLFQQRETKNSVDVLGSELLMPLLRLLDTDLASQALEVLEEPMQISGGPAAKHVLRMSLHNHLSADANEVDSVAEIFGIPQDSGWCVPRAGARQDTCRANVRAVYELHKAPVRLSRIHFQPDAIPVLTEEPLDDNLGSLVQNLHELSSFFQEDNRITPIPNRQLEARVAAILAKSTEATMDNPETPFVDIFDVGGLSSSEISDDSSSSDTESDLFEFDSPATTRFLS